ncbi:phosphatidylglycerol lysyltransferase domain-containing protein [Frankia sp. CiP3]|uniref:phosphatidylglycerol lysyltransferase domain-containing protein n=1 Tax=Frankia sp. CiP3 TaxID=2880971 RepID=UPI001EF3DB6C|nr:phosphatidylglycerol lysyltransferase domain-containing protein [Frankia sp. CiP3]
MPTAAAALVFIAGLIDIVSGVTPEWRDRLDVIRQILPGAASRQAAAFTVVVGLLLLLLARGLRRRKRRAWLGVVTLLGTSIVLHVVKGLDFEEAVASAALLLGLVLARGDFRAKGDPTTRWRALWVGLTLAAASIMVGLALLRMGAGRLLGPHPLTAQLAHVVEGLIGIHGPLRFSSERVSDLVTRILLTMGLLTIVTVVYLALRPPEPRPRLSADDIERMRALLTRHGDADSLGYFALRGDKTVVWSPTGKACVAYRVVSGVMLASGDPLGDNEAWPGAIREFLRIAAEHAWIPAVIGCSETGGKAWERVGLTALEFGDEAIIDVRTFTLEGRDMRNVRQAVGRVERAGYTYRAVRMSDLPPEEGKRLREQAEAWRGAETERGFSMALGRIGEPSDDSCVVVMAFDRDGLGNGGSPGDGSPAGSDPGSGNPGSGDSAGAGSGGARDTAGPESAGNDPRLRALLHFVPWGHRGLSLDLMVRDRAADNGLNDFLIVSAVRAAGGLNVDRLSLNFAFFRSALERGQRLGAGPVTRRFRGLLVFLSRWFQIDSLYRFNAKFQPQWSPRYICFPANRDLPRIALAMLEAEAFLVWPRLTTFPATRRLARLAHRRPSC